MTVILLRLLRPALFGFAILVAAGNPLIAGGTGGFLSGIEDLPLMRGLSETDAGTLVFESAAGRFVEAYAVGEVTPGDVLAFYGQSLPQLGWRQAGPTIFSREGEVLIIEFIEGSEADAPLTVRFALSPVVN